MDFLSPSFLAALAQIMLVNIVLSGDNAVVIALAAQGDWTLLITGLALSIPLIVVGSTVIMKMMDRFPIVVYIGAALIAWTAGEMIESDKTVLPFLPHVFHGTPYLAMLLTVGVLSYGWWSNIKNGRTAHDVLEADKHAAQRIEDRID